MRTMTLLACLLLLASACQGSPPASDGGRDRDPDAGTDSGVDPLDGGPLAGIDRTPDPSCEGTWVVAFQGTILDEDGAPVEGARAQVCARISPGHELICLVPPTTSATGFYTVVVEEGARCLDEAAMRAILPGTNMATTYCALELTPEDSVVISEAPLILHRTDAAATLPEIGDPSTLRTVVFADGLEVDLAPQMLYPSDAYGRLASRQIEVGAAPTCITRQASDLMALWAFSPEIAIRGEGALRIPNTEGLAPGATVELLVLGGLDTQQRDGTPIEEAELVPFGTATVSAGGSMLVSDPGSELVHLSWLGYRAL